MPSDDQSFTGGLKLDPKNLQASLKALEEHMYALKIERTSAQTALKAHSEFLTTITHEVRSSLGAIFAFADLLLGGALDDEQRSYAENLRSTADGLLHLLDEVLDHTKLTEGRMELSVKPFNLNELITSFAITLEARCTANGLTAEVHVDRDLPVMLKGDSMRIRQILVNFADNAVRFTEAGKVALNVKRIRASGDKVWIRFSISDTGGGLDEETKARLFEPFEQADDTTAETHGGSGLGLAICTKLVELMGGEIGCESTPGEGSVFWFEVSLGEIAEAQPDDDELFAEPASPPQPAEQPAARNPSGASTPADAGSGPLRTARPAHVLLVEDNKVDQMLVATYLKKFGHTYALAESGYEAVDMVKATDFDVVLMDLQLPEMDGFQTTGAIRRLRGPKADLPIIAITANSLHARRQTWKDAGMDACLTKPIDALKLFKAISHYRDNGRDIPKPPPDLPLVDDEELFEDSEELA